MGLGWFWEWNTNCIMTWPGRWCAAFKSCPTSFSFFSSMDYFRQTTPKAWTPDGIYCSYRTMYPTKPRRQLLLAIKKDLELLGKDDNALVAKQAHLFLKKWSRLKVTDFLELLWYTVIDTYHTTVSLARRSCRIFIVCCCCYCHCHWNAYYFWKHV